MRPITLTGFAGCNLAVDSDQLPENVGVFMENAYPGLGNLRPLNAHLTVATIPTSPQRMTIRRMGRTAINDALYWLGWTTVVHATLGFDNAPTERTYFTGSGSPKWTDNSIALAGGPPYPQASRELAVPSPDSAIGVVLTTDGTGTEAARFYVETFVNDLGWESAPSPVSTSLLCKPGALVALTLSSTPPAGNYGFATRRIYRTQPEAASDSAEFFFLREVTIGTGSTTDDGRALGELLATEGFLAPPATGFGLIALWNSMMAMLDGKELLVSEAGYPYAYPLRNRKGLKEPPLTTAKWGQNLLVLNSGTPVLWQGQDPASLQDTPLRLAQALRSVQGVVSFAHGVAWPSNEGLAYVGDSGQALLTRDILTEKQWKVLNPDTMIAGRSGRFYVCSYDPGSGGRKAFMIDPQNPGASLVFLSEGFDACEYDELADQLYVLQGGNVRKFAGDPSVKMTARYWSKTFLQLFETLYTAAKVTARGFPVTTEVWADGVQRDFTAAASGDSYSLATGYTAQAWQIRLSTTQDVQVARLGRSHRDLKGV